MRTTHTVVKLPLSQAAFDEIKNKLIAAEYSHCFLLDGSIDMTQIAVYSYNVRQEPPRKVPEDGDLDMNEIKVNWDDPGSSGV